ncbi:TadE-like protein [Planctomycetes bacterium MalM25]|nr:TadE-like protein [Planctomycetes bacterium MalM25]
MLVRKVRSTKRKTRRPRRSEDRRGAATVEFALTSFIVFFLFMTMIEFARFHIVRHSMDQAVYMGARVGIVPGATANEVDQTVRDRLTLAGISDATISISPAVITDATTSVTVNATAPFGQNSWATPKFFGGVNVVAEITLDHENIVFQ